MRVGMDLLRGRAAAWFKGKRVGLLSHQAAVCADGATSAQALHAALGEGLVALFGPEHGFFGQAGPGVKTVTRRHPDWRIPVYSLYGERRKPAPAWLAGLDVLICDLQDLGVRCYTYLGTLKLVLEACAEAGVEVWVADRPIPLPKVVDGPVAEPAFFSFVAPCAVPLVYGMTPAETARWLAREIPSLRLKTVPMEGWDTASRAWGGDYPSFVPPSPGIKSWETAQLYPATVFTEALPGIDCGRGTNLLFRVLGAPWMRAERFCAAFNEGGAFGLSAHPYRYTAASGAYAGRELDGIRLTVMDFRRYRPAAASLALLQTLVQEVGAARIWQHKGVRPQWFDKLYGGDATRLALQAGTPAETVERRWRVASARFLRQRASCLLYDR